MKTKTLSPAFILFASFIFLSYSSIAQFSEEKIDRLLSGQYKTDDPGAVALVAQNGKVLFKKAYGMANLELGVPMQTNMVFEIGSITKQFTAIAILMLVEDGKIKLEDEITKFIPDYPTHGHSITVHHLLTHTSGIRSYTDMPAFGEFWRKDYEPSEFIDVFKNEPMDFAPGKKWMYNNSAYYLLGMIIEKASGMGYPDFIEKKIFQPLGMNNSFYGSRKKLIKNRACGYQKEGEGYINAEYLSLTLPYAAGSLMSTVDDLLTWNTAVHSYKLVPEETLKKAFTNYTLSDGKETNYGYGWGLNSLGDNKTFEHSGGIFGFPTNAIYIPDLDIFVTVLSNNESESPVEVSTRIAGLVAGVEFPDMEDVIKVKPEKLQEYVGVYEFGDDYTRTISLSEGQLYSMRTGGSRFEIYPFERDKFFFRNSLSTLTFNRDEKGEIAGMTFINRLEISTGKKTDEVVTEKKEIGVSEEIMKRYTGVFELQPGFDLTFTLEDGKLMSQATGQDKFQVFPLSETVFFPKVVDAEIEFFVEGDGTVKRAE
ncbi:MAG: serine hydrolase, partial [Bacteroidales bacterium]|nr:serine hydrolase [Bacteroidales bacterium]